MFKIKNINKPFNRFERDIEKDKAKESKDKILII